MDCQGNDCREEKGEDERETPAGLLDLHGRLTLRGGGLLAEWDVASSLFLGIPWAAILWADARFHQRLNTDVSGLL